MIIKILFVHLHWQKLKKKFNEDDFYLNYKIGIIDWENGGYIFRYAEDTDDLCIE